MKRNAKADKILDIATKRGFFFPTAEIYNGPAGFWTYGHLGTLLKHKWENLWRCYFFGLDPNYYEIEGSAILPKKTFEASGHLQHFNDPLTLCEKCKFRFRADHLIEDELTIHAEGISTIAMDKLIQDNKLTCPRCGGPLIGVKMFNMMFDVKIGATGDDTAYLSPETAQNSYLAFKRQFLALREKLPMGLAMIGKAYRNEVSPRQGFFRLREFTQAELQIFFDPDTIDKIEEWNTVKNYKLQLCLHKNSEKITEISCEDANKKLSLPKFYVYHLAKVQQFYLDKVKIPKQKFRLRELSPEEKAFYNKIHFDAEINLETLGGFKEVAGVHYRTDHDLRGHQGGSGEIMEVTINENNKTKKIIPHVLELSFGVDRNIWALLDIFYKEEKERTLLAFPAHLAPFDVALFPLVNKDGIPEKTEHVYERLQHNFKVSYDAKGSIGRMYRRVDEIGIPAAVTVDHETIKKDTVTLRDRDSMHQVRIPIHDLPIKITTFLAGTPLVKLGKTVA